MQPTNNQKRLLVSGSVNRHLFNLALPAFISALSMFSFIFVDMYFISKLGQNNLTAISYAAPIVDVIISVALGFGIAMSSISARKIGAGKFEDVKKYLYHGIFMCAFFGLIIAVFGNLTTYPIFSLIGASKTSIHLIHNFMSVWYVFSGLIFFNFMCTSTLRAYGKPKGAAFIQVCSAFINLALDPLFIFHLHLGITGAAVSGAIARILSAIVLLYLVKHHGLLSLNIKLKLRELIQSWKNIFHMMIPAALTNMISPLATLWITHLLARYNQSSVAGFGVAAKIQSLAVIPLLVLSGSVGPVVGQNYAAGQPMRSYQALKSCEAFSVLWGCLVAIVLSLISKPLAHIFSSNQETIAVVHSYFIIIPTSYIAWGIIMMVNANFNALGFPKRSTFISALRMLVFFVPSSVVFLHFFGYRGIFIAFSASTFLAAFIAFFWAQHTYRGVRDASLNR